MPATKTAKSLKVGCPECFEHETVTIDLNDLHACCCGSCNAEFSPQEAMKAFQAKADQWAKVVRWIDAAPTE